jgi:carotenoid cleavage dioxygenase-like enzyme
MGSEWVLFCDAALALVRLAKNHKVIFMPFTAHYKNDDKGKHYLEMTVSALTAHNNVTCVKILSASLLKHNSTLSSLSPP